MLHRHALTLTLRNFHDRGDELLKESVDLEQRRPVVVNEVNQQP